LSAEPPVVFTDGHHFSLAGTHSLDTVAGTAAGPLSVIVRVRGDYDKVMAGVRAFRDAGLPLSLSAVVYRSTLASLPFTYQIADVLDAGKLKLILPLKKGNALDPRRARVPHRRRGRRGVRAADRAAHRPRLAAGAAADRRDGRFSTASEPHVHNAHGRSPEPPTCHNLSPAPPGHPT
jgi:hypothetical protein